MKKILMTLRLREDLLAALKERALTENRTLSNLVETLLAREALPTLKAKP